MTHRDDDLERRLETWLADTARPMPPELFDDIVASAPRVARSGVRAEFPSGGRWRLALGGLAAVAVLAIGLGLAGRWPLGPEAGDSGSPSSSLEPRFSPAITPAATPRPGASDTAAPSPSPPAGTPTATGSIGRWHRNNYNAGAERLVCTEATETWTCNYQVVDGTGWFSGQNITESWQCPGWFPNGICDDVVAVYHGRFVILPQEGETAEPGSVVSQDYVITNVHGHEVLQLYWVDQFVCPWYRTKREARAEDFVCWFAP